MGNYHTLLWNILHAFSLLYIDNRLERWETTSKLEPPSLCNHCLLLPPYEQCREMECELWSVHNALSSVICSSYMTTFCPCTIVESLRRCLSFWADPTLASHRLQLFKKCSSMGPYHMVHLLGLSCSGTDPHERQLPQPLWPIVGSSPSLQVWPGAAPARALHGLQLFQATSTVAPVAFSTAAGGDLLCVMPRCCREHLLGSGELLQWVWSTSCPSALTVGTAVSPTYSQSSQLLLCSIHAIFSVHSPRGKTNVAHWLSSGQRSEVRGPFGVGWDSS